jgi:branched-chain amino acid transport system permease protein
MLPWVITDPRYRDLIITMGIYFILASGLRLIMSVGQVSFAQAAFWGIGAYSSAILVMKAGLSFWLSLPLSGIISAFIALLIGYPCLRLKGPYFFIITMSFGEVARLVFTSWIDLFGGTNGISGIPAPDPITISGVFSISFPPRGVEFYYLLMLLIIVSFFVMYRIERSHFGKACGAIREFDDLAASLGINIMRHSIILFVVGCFFAGIAGSFYAHYMTYIGPGYFSFHESLLFLIIAVIGGTESIFGIIIGAVLLTILPEFTREAKQFESIIYGAFVLVVLLFMPSGIWGMLKKIFRIKPLSKSYI